MAIMFLAFHVTFLTLLGVHGVKVEQEQKTKQGIVERAPAIVAEGEGTRSGHPDRPSWSPVATKGSGQ